MLIFERDQLVMCYALIVYWDVVTRRFRAEVRQGRDGMLGGLGEGGQLVLEGLVGRAVAETASGCRVERRDDAGEFVFGQLGQVALAWQEPADPTVGVLDGTFLPGTMRIAEVGFGADWPARRP